MTHIMTLAEYNTLGDWHFRNGAVKDEIAAALKSREELLEILRKIQWQTILHPGGSKWPTCVGCGAVSYEGRGSIPEHNDNCPIEAALETG